MDIKKTFNANVPHENQKENYLISVMINIHTQNTQMTTKVLGCEETLVQR